MITILTQPINISSRISSRSTWIDINVSDIVPSGTDGVILGLGYDGASAGQSYHYTIRKKGSTDDRKTRNRSQAYADGAILAFTGVDTNRVFQYYTNNPLAGTSEPTLYIRGYTTNGDFSYRTDSQDITPAGIGWQTIDVSSYLDSNYSNGAVLIQVENWEGAYNKFDVRAVGDTIDLYSSGKRLWNLQHKFYIVSLNSSRQFQFAREDNNVKLYLWGGIKSTFYSNINRDSGGFTIDGDGGAWTGASLDYSGIVLALAYNSLSPSWIAFKKPSDSWTPPPYYQHNRDTGVVEPVVIPADGNKNYEWYLKDTEPDTDYYYTGRLLTPFSYTVDADVTFNLNSETIGEVEYNYLQLAEVIFNLEPDATVEHIWIFEKIVEISFEFIPIVDYELQYIFFEVEANSSFNLLPEFTEILETTFIKDANITFEFLGETFGLHTFDYEKSPEVIFTFALQFLYSLGVGFVKDANVDFSLISEMLEEFGWDFFEEANLSLIPDFTEEAILLTAPVIKAIPQPILPELRRMFQLKGQKILIFPAYRRIADPYEGNKEEVINNPIAIVAIVRDFSPHGLIWREYGLKEIGAKELIIYKKHIGLLKIAKRVQIKDWQGLYQNYRVFKDAIGGNVQVWERNDFARIILERDE